MSETPTMRDSANGFAPAVDTGAASAIVAHWFGLLPTTLGSIATALAIAWYALQIWESATGQRIRTRLSRKEGLTHAERRQERDFPLAPDKSDVEGLDG